MNSCPAAARCCAAFPGDDRPPPPKQSFATSWPCPNPQFGNEGLNDFKLSAWLGDFVGCMETVMKIIDEFRNSEQWFCVGVRNLDVKLLLQCHDDFYGL